MSSAILERARQRVRDADVVIVGAGFSFAASDGQAPLMGTFFDQLSHVDFPILSEFITDQIGDPATANVEDVLLSLDQIKSSPIRAILGWADQWQSHAPAVKQELCRYTIERLRTMPRVPRDNFAGICLRALPVGHTVISMNYDNIAESVLSTREGMTHWRANANCPHCKMRMLLQKACNCSGGMDVKPRDWTGAILKLHGSIAWKRCTNSTCCSFECLVADEQCRPFEPCDCPNCCNPCDCALVMPRASFKTP